ncbi:MAG TPA: glycosyltransferase family 39 protein [Chloroflexota bacterium]|nr:glycosyltransferase family 39 protein [Chloroflexota bacterium]
MHTEWSRRKLFVAAVVLALVPRLLLFVAVQPWLPSVSALVIDQPNSDSLNYHELGVILARDHVYALDATGTPEGDRVPLYPMFLAAVYTLFGTQPWPALLLQILIASVGSGLLALTAADAFGSRAGKWTAGLFALAPLQVLYPLSLMSETMFVSLLIACAYSVSRALRPMPDAQPVRQLALAGIALGLATLTRPAAEYLCVGLAALMIVRWRRQPRAATLRCAVFLATFALVVAPWFVRNAQTFGVATLSANGSANVLLLYVLPMEMERRSASREVAAAQLSAEVTAEMDRDGRGQDNELLRSQYDQLLGWRYIRTYPVSFAKHYALGIFRTLAGVAIGSFGPLLGIATGSQAFDIWAFGDPVTLIRQWLANHTPKELGFALVVSAYSLVTYVLASVGLVRAARARRWNRSVDPAEWVLALWLLCAAYFVLVTGPGGDARYRVPSEPFLIALAAAALVSTRSTAHRTRTATLEPLQPSQPVLNQAG